MWIAHSRTGSAVICEMHPLGAATDDAAPDQSERWRRDDAKDRCAVRNQRDIDRIFVTAGNEFPSAIQWIDKNDIGTRHRRPVILGLLLGNDWKRRCKTIQAVADHGLRGFIRRRQWRSIGFDVDRAATGRLSDRERRGGADGGQPVYQLGVGCGIEAAHRDSSFISHARKGSKQTKGSGLARLRSAGTIAELRAL